MALAEFNRFATARRRPEQQPRQVVAPKAPPLPSTWPSSIRADGITGGGSLVSDLRAQDLLREVLYELKHIRLHAEALSGENLRGDVEYADQ